MPTAKSIDVYGIEERLRKEDKSAMHYINKLKEALTKQQELTGSAIGKMRALAVKASTDAGKVSHIGLTKESVERLLEETEVMVLAMDLYDEYCTAVGGKAFNGDNLPKAEQFFADPNKQTQVQAWIRVAYLARPITKPKDGN